MYPNKLNRDYMTNEKKCLVSLSFDDGRYEQYDKFYPILAECGLKGTFYVTTERIGWKEVIGWDELKVLYKEGNEIGSHTHTHPHLTTLSDEKLDYEFRKSQEVLRSFNCSTIAYPYGECNKRVIEEVKKHFLAARGYNVKISKIDKALNLPNQEKYNLIALQMDQSITFPIINDFSLFNLPFSIYKKTLRELFENGINKSSWIIFVIHGKYNLRNISWIFKKSLETNYFFEVIKKLSSLKNVTAKSIMKNDRLSKFKWMCKYLAENPEIEVMPIFKATKEHFQKEEKP